MEFASPGQYPQVIQLTEFKLSFLRDLWERCMADVGNEEFWSQVKEVGRPLSLISEKEASKYGGTSEISESKSKQVCADSVFWCTEANGALEYSVYYLNSPA